MKYTLEQLEKYSLAKINSKKSNLTTAYITVDIQKETSLVNQATEEMFSQALLSGSGNLNREEFVDKVKKGPSHLNGAVDDPDVMKKVTLGE